jgi:glyoxylase-like metal-dependent hydrolase (beta-lactamase superfamily II)
VNISRRYFSVLAGSALAAAAVDRSARAVSPVRSSRSGEPTWFAWKGVGDNAWAGIGEGGNSLALFDGDLWLLVDTKNAGFADTLRREAGSLTPRKATLARVINTHHHMDHTGGNYAFAPDVPIAAYSKAVRRVREQVERYKERLKGVPAQLAQSVKPGAAAVRADVEHLLADVEKLTPERFVPSESIDQDTEITLGRRRVALKHFGPGHTDNDIIVHIPDLNLLHTGDLLFMGRHPVMDVRGGATSAGWLASLAKLIPLCNDKTVVIPGHGDITDVSGLKTQVRYFETVRTMVKKAIENGRTREEARALPIDGFEGYGPPQGRNGVLEAVYDELKNEGAK